jgi:hypothetical protein
MQTREFFLLDPDHEQFAVGASHKLPVDRQGCILFFLGIFVLAGLLIAGKVARQWVHFVILSTSYAETQGQVLDREIESDDGATYYVTYRFVVDDRAHTVEESVSKTTYRAVREGQSLTVRYARHDPAIATVEPGRLGDVLLMTGFCLVWNGFILVVAWVLVREILKRRKLDRGGRRIVGQVVRCSGRRDSDGDFVLDLRFGFRSPQTGAWIEGKDSHIRRDLEDKPLPPPGTPLHVLYLDDKTYLAL